MRPARPPEGARSRLAGPADRPTGAPGSAVLQGPGTAASGWPLDEASLRDPYPQFRAWREAGPLHWTPHLFGGAWVLTRHADCEAALRDERLSAQRTGGWVMRRHGQTESRADGSRRELGPFQRLFARALLFVDAPDHTRLRRLMQPAFTPSALQALRAGIEVDCQALLAAADPAPGGEFDFIAALARPLPARVIGRVLGVPEADGPQFMAWSDDLAGFLGAAQPDALQAQRAQAALVAMVRCFDSLLDQRRGAPRDDLLSHLAAMHEQGGFEGPLGGRAELLAQCAMLLFAGHETTRHLLGNAVHGLLADPARWRALRERHAADPGCLGPVVREVLRWQCPVQYTGRRVARDFTLHGQPLRRGELVIVMIGAANRDPARYPAPDALDFDRPPQQSLAFGIGAHFCLGAALTMMEAEVVLGQLLQRWPAPRLRDAAGDWLANPLYRGLRSLWVQPGGG